MDEWMDGWMDCLTDGWLDGCMDGWMDGWMGEWRNWKKANVEQLVTKTIVKFNISRSLRSVPEFINVLSCLQCTRIS